MEPPRRVSIKINGDTFTDEVESRLLLSDCIRDRVGLTGTHVGCEHGVCGACTIQLDGSPVRSCLMLAVQADGLDITTVEGLAGKDQALHPLQDAFSRAHALQCGFCTPGLLMSLEPMLRLPGTPSRDEVREAISGVICRCTGYENIVDAVLLALSERDDPKEVEPQDEATAV